MSDTKSNTFTLMWGSMMPSAKIVSASLIQGSVYVGATPTNPPQPTWKIADGMFAVNIECERLASTKAAALFSDFCGGDNSKIAVTYTATNSKGPPATLNFCFGMDLTFGHNNVTQAFYFGQGHFESAGQSVNNWWMCGSSISPWDGGDDDRKITVGDLEIGLSGGPESADSLGFVST